MLTMGVAVLQEQQLGGGIQIRDARRESPRDHFLRIAGFQDQLDLDCGQEHEKVWAVEVADFG